MRSAAAGSGSTGKPGSRRRWWFLAVMALGANIGISCVSGPGAAPYERYPRTGWTQIQGATYIGEEMCAGCHDRQAKDFSHTVHGQASVRLPDQETHVSCEQCHGPGSKHAENDGDPRFILKGDSQNCFQCHRDKRAEFSLLYHHPVPEGRMNCSDCHEIHATGGRSKTSLSPNEKCQSCHEEKRGPWVFEHEAMRDGCIACHKPHGSMNNKLLIESDTNLCLKCHYNQQTHQFQGHYIHRRALNATRKTCVECHTAIHGSNFSKEFRGVGSD